MPYTRYVWEKHFGAIPKGCVVLHKDGNKLNDKKDNLRLMTKLEVLRLNKKNQDVEKKSRNLKEAHYMRSLRKAYGLPAAPYYKQKDFLK